MEMISIPKTDYAEFLNWKAANGGTVISSAGKAPASGWRHYVPGTNPFAKGTLDVSAQQEIAAVDINTAISLVKALPNKNDYLPTLEGMKKRQVLRENGF